jgi:hypothetical protein
LRVDINSQFDANSNAYNLIQVDSVLSQEPGLAQLIWEADDMTPKEVTIKYNDLVDDDVKVSPLSITEYNLLLTLIVNADVTDDTRFVATEQSLLPISMKLLPSRTNTEAKSVTVIEPTGETKVREQGSGSSYDVYLRPCNQDMAENTRLVITATVGGQVQLDRTTMEEGTEFVITGSTAWNVDATDDEDKCKVTVSVQAVNDGLEEGDHFVSLVHNVTDKDGGTILLSDESRLYAKNVLVRLFDDDLPGVIITQSGTRTNTVEIDDLDKTKLMPFMYEDEYSIQLTQEPPATVTVTVWSKHVASDRNTVTNEKLGRNFEKRNQIFLGPGNQTCFHNTLPTLCEFVGDASESLELKFTTQNWMDPQYVRVLAFNDDIAEGVGKYNIALAVCCTLGSSHFSLRLFV